jgi:hypothetical protein
MMLNPSDGNGLKYARQTHEVPLKDRQGASACVSGLAALWGLTRAALLQARSPRAPCNRITARRRASEAGRMRHARERRRAIAPI